MLNSLSSVAVFLVGLLVLFHAETGLANILLAINNTQLLNLAQHRCHGCGMHAARFGLLLQKVLAYYALNILKNPRESEIIFFCSIKSMLYEKPAVRSRVEVYLVEEAKGGPSKLLLSFLLSMEAYIRLIFFVKTESNLLFIFLRLYLVKLLFISDMLCLQRPLGEATLDGDAQLMIW